MRSLLPFLFLLLLAACVSRPYPQFKQLSKPEENFEVFWHTFSDNYAFFDARSVNWQQSYATYRPLVNAHTSDTTLLRIFSEMLTPLHDGHITIEHKGAFVFKGESTRNTFKTAFKGMRKAFQDNCSAVLAANGFSAIESVGDVLKEEPFLRYASTNAIGYLCITRFFNSEKGVYGNANDEARDATEMLRLLDSALVQLQPCANLIIDLRTNGGGHSGTELAGRFVSDTLPTHLVRTMQHGQLSAPQQRVVLPSTGVRFTHPIVVLTSDRTASSAEDFLLALLPRSNLTLIGTATAGMFSDMYGFRLPNGMYITLSNQCYLDNSKQVLEGRGISPNFEIGYSRETLENHSDPQLEKAFELLR